MLAERGFELYREVLELACRHMRDAEALYDLADADHEPVAFARLQAARAEVSSILREAREAWQRGNDAERVSH
ncbi:hypothetical protein Aaci_1088 [Alicyclobacillus acidocaldarius subsp. acidocaldarius DSM 446]|uniref:Uncharacterized protein n=1 Tax=Alicyclobacillus acidocaldarius subsp. acidocaldarius (strain ATCC 27009 / DSM 446 / BCRC 14685 / JCM 5260 / KCTC 1825 / NBRC 15652 / NCIMB 11725 / NRRL B-14509 / 104-IA) TaxID=521098 RepID=C8WVK2_ALIAD|nr:hypothetical protein Aaci_1088 [Alicyclobacillus acidocaldarius subsp. acidocaldarius DSM 446]